MNSFTIENTSVEDLPFIYQLFDLSVKYQEERGYISWKNYDRKAIVHDVESKSQYKIIADSQIALVFSVRYEDKIIWREREQGNAIYLHRIVVNPQFKGQKLFGQILNWAKGNAKKNRLRYIRMDTWADNPTIINYYLSFGFKFIEAYTTTDDPALPIHNRKLKLALLELAL